MQLPALSSPDAADPRVTLTAYVELLRPANVVTALADILAGAAVAGALLVLGNDAQLAPLLWLMLAGAALYAGGVMFNDVLHMPLDQWERPERPLPGGRASRVVAGTLAGSLLAIGLLAARQHGLPSFLLAVVIASMALFYNAFAKHYTVLGPLSMGLCRSGNLLLGLSIVPAMLSEYWYVGLIPLAYVGAITLVSRGEVAGGERRSAQLALGLVLLVLAGFIALDRFTRFELLFAGVFLLWFAVRVVPPFLAAATEPSAPNSRQAVTVGVLSLIVLNATIAAGFAGIGYGVVVALLIPWSAVLARRYGVA